LQAELQAEPAVNAERLHALARELFDELNDTQTPERLAELVEELRTQASQPGATGPEQEVSRLRGELRAALTDAASDDLSPAWRQALEETGIAELFGQALLAQIEDAFARNGLTPSMAADELEPLASRLQTLRNSLASLITAFDLLHIGAEELGPGEFEIGFLIPRDAVKSELASLGDEFVQLERRILRPFYELSIGSRPDVEVRAISSSGFQVFLNSPAATALCVATAIERIVSVLEKIMNIRKAYGDIKSSGVVPDEDLAPLETRASTIMSEQVIVISGDLVEEFGQHLDEHRRNELQRELEHALSAIANRLDRGYHIDVRTGALPEPAEGDEEPESPVDPEVAAAAAAVGEKQRALRFMNLTGRPILALPESAEGESPSDDDDTLAAA
jgi:hypothetical protein